MRILKLVSLMYLDVHYCNICMLFGISSEFKFCKKMSMTLLSEIMILICSIQNSDGPKLISELLFLSQEAAGPKTSCLLRELGLRSWDHQLLIVSTLQGSSSTWHQWRRSGIKSQDPREKLQLLAPMEKKRNHRMVESHR